MYMYDTKVVKLVALLFDDSIDWHQKDMNEKNSGHWANVCSACVCDSDYYYRS